jgi:hypothetical protein
LPQQYLQKYFAAYNIGLKKEVLNMPNETTQAAIEAAVNGTNLYGPFDTVDSLMEALGAKNRVHKPIQKGL